VRHSVYHTFHVQIYKVSHGDICKFHHHLLADGNVNNQYPVVYIPGYGNFQLPGLWDIINNLKFREKSETVDANDIKFD
jgi:hypothetical protein